MTDDGIKKISGLKTITQAEFETMQRVEKKDKDGNVSIFYLMEEDDGETLTKFSEKKFKALTEIYGFDPTTGEEVKSKNVQDGDTIFANKKPAKAKAQPKQDAIVPAPPVKTTPVPVDKDPVAKSLLADLAAEANVKPAQAKPVQTDAKPAEAKKDEPAKTEPAAAPKQKLMTPATDKDTVKAMVNNAPQDKAALKYYYAPIINIQADASKLSNEEGIELQNAIAAVALTMPRTKDGLINLKAAQNLSLADIDTKISSADKFVFDFGEEYAKLPFTADDEVDTSKLDDETIAKARAYENAHTVRNAYSELRDVVMKHQGLLLTDNKLRTQEPPAEEPGILAQTGEALVDGVKFVNDHVLRVSDARKGAKAAGKRVEAQYKQNGIVSGLLSTAGGTAGLITSAGSGAIGTVTDATEALTDAVDNMEDGYAKDAAKTGSGVVKVANGILNGGAALLDGTSELLKNGLYINKLWGGDDNDEAVKAEIQGAVDNIVSKMTKDPKKEAEDFAAKQAKEKAEFKANATAEEKEEFETKQAEEKEKFEAKQAQEKTEYSYITNVKDVLGLTEAQLDEMDNDDIREMLLEAINAEKIPIDLVKAFAVKKAINQGVKEQSELLVTDGDEALAKLGKAGDQLVDGVVDTAVGATKTVGKTLGALVGYGWAWGDDDDEVKPDAKADDTKAAAAPAPVHTASTKEIITEARKADIEELKNTPEFQANMTKLQENKQVLLDRIVPPEFIAGAVDAIFEENYDVEYMNEKGVKKAKNDIKAALYEQMGTELEKKFSDFEAHRLFQRSLNESQFGEDTFWTNFWNEIDKAKDQENTAGNRGFWKNAGSYLAGILKFPATAVLTDAPYTIAGVAGGLPFWQYQVAFSLFLGSDEHIRGTENIIKGKFNSAQKAAGWDENGYATVKDIVVWWTKHYGKKLAKPQPKPQPKPDPEPDCPIIHPDKPIPVDPDPVPIETPDDILITHPEDLITNIGNIIPD